MPTATIAIRQLGEAIDAPHPPGAPPSSWRWSVRQEMAGVRDALAAQTPRQRSEWIVARTTSMLRERNELLIRLSTLGKRVLETDAIDELRLEMHRLLADVRRHLQRRRDLADDEIDLECRECSPARRSPVEIRAERPRDGLGQGPSPRTII
jgi:hypothetical protein